MRHSGRRPLAEVVLLTSPDAHVQDAATRGAVRGERTISAPALGARPGVSLSAAPAGVARRRPRLSSSTKSTSTEWSRQAVCVRPSGRKPILIFPPSSAVCIAAQAARRGGCARVQGRRGSPSTVKVPGSWRGADEASVVGGTLVHLLRECRTAGGPPARTAMRSYRQSLGLVVGDVHG